LYTEIDEDAMGMARDELVKGGGIELGNFALIVSKVDLSALLGGIGETCETVLEPLQHLLRFPIFDKLRDKLAHSGT